RCYRLLAARGEPGDVYTVCSGDDRSVEELARELVALSGTHVELEVDPALVRPVDLPVLRGDPAKVAAATGWHPEIPLSRTLADLLDDMRARPATNAR
ncbi:MAG: GDP-mannose 4,6 dehydratase, partial [Acidimicrobiia bacterium]